MYNTALDSTHDAMLMCIPQQHPHFKWKQVWVSSGYQNELLPRWLKSEGARELKDKVEEAWQMKSNFIRPASGVSCYPYLKRIMVLQRSALPSRLSSQIHHVLDCFF